jgi:hypothetical protein
MLLLIIIIIIIIIIITIIIVIIIVIMFSPYKERFTLLLHCALHISSAAIFTLTLRRVGKAKVLW